MAGELGTISGEVRIDYDDSGLARADQGVKNFTETTEDAGKRGKEAWGKIGSAVQLASVAIVAAAGLWARSAISAAEDSIRTAAGLENVFKQMGGEAHEAFTTASTAAEELGRRIAVDDDEIAKIQTKLATFGNVWRDPVHGAENFGRASELAFDLAAAGFGDASGNATALGKALQDPTRGVTALARSGVSFTAAEKEKIKALQESGDLLGAQEMIYKALEEQVGGTAEATVTDSQRATLAVSELSESFGKLLLPAVKTVTGWITRLTDWLEQNKTTALAVGAVVVGLATAVLAISAALKVYRAIATVVTAVQWAMNASFLANPITWIVLAIIALIAIIVLLATRTQFFQKLWDAVWGFVQKVFKSAVDFIKSALENIGQFMAQNIQFWMAIWSALVAFIKGRIDFWVAVIRTGVNLVRAIITNIFNAIKGFIQNVIQGWTIVIQGGVNRIKSVINGISTIVSAIRGFFQRARDAVADRISSLVALATGLPGRIMNGIGNLGSRLFSAGRDLIIGLVNGIRNAASAAVNAAKNVVGDAVQGAKNLLGIGSPSRVFRDEVGQWIPRGLALGIRTHAQEPVREVERMTLALATAPVGVSAAASTAAGVATAGTTYTFAAGAIVLDVTRLRSIEDVVKAVEQIRPTSRQYVKR